MRSPGERAQWGGFCLLLDVPPLTLSSWPPFCSLPRFKIGTSLLKSSRQLEPEPARQSASSVGICSSPARPPRDRRRRLYVASQRPSPPSFPLATQKGKPASPQGPSGAVVLWQPLFISSFSSASLLRYFSSSVMLVSQHFNLLLWLIFAFHYVMLQSRRSPVSSTPRFCFLLKPYLLAKIKVRREFTE